MNNTLKKMSGFAALLIGLAISFSGCVEHRYYETNHHHSHDWYDRHHQPPPAGVNFELDVHQ